MRMFSRFFLKACSVMTHEAMLRPPISQDLHFLDLGTSVGGFLT
jgi:hypothetical protein